MTLTSERQTTTVAELSHVTKRYGDRRILDDISLKVHAHEIVALVGRSGGGKSTVLRVLAGLSPDHTGHREVSGAPAVAFQEPRLFPWRDVLTNVRYGLNRTALSPDAARARSTQALAEIGLADHAHAWPLTLSGGQAQRVSLARARSPNPNCCCSTSHSARSTRSPGCRCGHCCSNCGASTDSASYSSPMTSTRRSSSPTECSSSKMAGSRIPSPSTPRGPLRRSAPLDTTHTAATCWTSSAFGSSTTKPRFIVHVALAAALVCAACVSRSTGPLEAIGVPARVPSSESCPA